MESKTAWIKLWLDEKTSSFLIRALKFVRSTVKLGDKEHLDKEQICVKELFPVTNCQFTM